MNKIDRIDAGVRILVRGDVIDNSVVRKFDVVGDSGRMYQVIRDGVEWSCTCPDYTHRGHKCKHIYAALLSE